MFKYKSIIALIFFLLFPLTVSKRTITWTSTTQFVRSCNYAKTDFQYFGVDSYTDNGFIVINTYDINLENINIEDFMNNRIDEKGFIKVNAVSNDNKTKKKIEMGCKYIYLTYMETLFCDVQNDNNYYDGIQLINEGDFTFSSNYDQTILKCNSPPSNQGGGNSGDNNNNEENNDKNNNKDNNDNNDNNENESNNDNENKENQKDNNIQEENNNNNNNNNIKENYNSNVEELINEQKNVQGKTKKKNILNISTGAAIGVTVAFLAIAGAGGFFLSQILTGKIFLNNNINSAQIGQNNVHTKISQDENNKNNPEKLDEKIINKKRIIIISLVITGISLFTILGILFSLPIKKVKEYDNYIFNEEAYLQNWNNSGNFGSHLHWCGDPYNPTRTGYDCPKDVHDTNRCWFCKYGSAVSSFLHFIRIEPNEKFIKSVVNETADLVWDKFGFGFGNELHEHCFGVKEKENKEHFVHIKTIYRNNNTCDIFDPDGGNKKANLNEFKKFIVKLK